MSVGRGFREIAWPASLGAALLVGAVVAALLVRDGSGGSDQLALRARKLELVDQMRVALASATAGELGAMLGAPDAEAQAFAEDARAALRDLDRQRGELASLLEISGFDEERALLASCSSAFETLRQVDEELLDLATRNTNLKASALATGPLAEASAALQEALSRVAAADAPDASRTGVLALGAQAAALRLQTLLPAHILEASDAEMDRMELLMGEQEREVQRRLNELRSLPAVSPGESLPAADAAWAQFLQLKADVIRLSRENTNIRSLALSLDRRRAASLACQQGLEALRQAVGAEPAEVRVPRPR